MGYWSLQDYQLYQHGNFLFIPLFQPVRSLPQRPILGRFWGSTKMGAVVVPSEAFPTPQLQLQPPTNSSSIINLHIFILNKTINLIPLMPWSMIMKWDDIEGILLQVANKKMITAHSSATV